MKFSDDKEWRPTGLNYLRLFVNEHKGQNFTTSEVRQWAYAKGCPAPRHERAWGMVMTTGKRLGLIRKVGFALATYPDRPNSGATPAGCWTVA